MSKEDKILEILKDIQKNFKYLGIIVGGIAVWVFFIGLKLNIYFWQ